MRYMKKLILILCTAFACAQFALAQVTFRFSDGIYNQTLKSQVERNVSALLTEINRAERNRVGLLNLGGVRIDDNAANGLRSLWKNIHFRCEWNNNVQSCIQDFTGYEVRQIPVEMKPLDNTYKGELHKELTISFNKQGVITGVRTAIDNNSYLALLSGGKANLDMRMRREILKFVEDFRSYYVEKNIAALDEIFSDDALIITGRVIKTMGKSQADGVSQQVKEKVVYSKQNKQQYINNLRTLFQSNEYINVDFSDIELMRHGSNPNFYGVKLRQKWASNDIAVASTQMMAMCSCCGILQKKEILRFMLEHGRQKDQAKKGMISLLRISSSLALANSHKYHVVYIIMRLIIIFVRYLKSLICI